MQIGSVVSAVPMFQPVESTDYRVKFVDEKVDTDLGGTVALQGVTERVLVHFVIASPRSLYRLREPGEKLPVEIKLREMAAEYAKNVLGIEAHPKRVNWGRRFRTRPNTPTRYN